MRLPKVASGPKRRLEDSRKLGVAGCREEKLSVHSEPSHCMGLSPAGCPHLLGTVAAMFDTSTPRPPTGAEDGQASSKLQP